MSDILGLRKCVCKYTSKRSWILIILLLVITNPIYSQETDTFIVNHIFNYSIFLNIDNEKCVKLYEPGDAEPVKIVNYDNESNIFSIEYYINGLLDSKDIFEYENGALIRIIRYEESKKRVLSELEYDKSGRLVRIRDGRFACFLTYDEKFRVIEVHSTVLIDGKEKMAWKIGYLFDENSVLIEEYEYDLDDSTVFLISKFSYKDNKRIGTVVERVPTGELYSRSEYIYNEDGNPLRTNHYNWKDELKTFVVFEYE